MPSEEGSPVLLLLPILNAAASDCPAGVQQLAVVADRAFDAYTLLDVAQFQQNVQTLQVLIGCLEEPLSHDLAVSLHRIYALGAWLQDEPNASVASWRASIALEPRVVPGDDLIPPGSRILELYQQAVEAGPGEEAPSGVQGLRVDGTASGTYPTQRASLVQHPVEEGWQTAYIYGTLPAAFVQPPSSGWSARPRSQRLLIAGLVAGTGAGLGLGSAALLKTRYEGLSAGDTGNGLLVANQAAGLSGYTLGAASLGLTASAVIVGAW